MFFRDSKYLNVVQTKKNAIGLVEIEIFNSS